LHRRYGRLGVKGGGEADDYGVDVGHSQELFIARERGDPGEAATHFISRLRLGLGDSDELNMRQLCQNVQMN
jgi:hypothetical protein